MANENELVKKLMDHAKRQFYQYAEEKGLDIPKKDVDNLFKYATRRTKKDVFVQLFQNGSVFLFEKTINIDNLNYLPEIIESCKHEIKRNYVQTENKVQAYSPLFADPSPVFTDFVYYPIEDEFGNCLADENGNFIAYAPTETIGSLTPP